MPCVQTAAPPFNGKDWQMDHVTLLREEYARALAQERADLERVLPMGKESTARRIREVDAEIARVKAEFGHEDQAVAHAVKEPERRPRSRVKAEGR